MRVERATASRKSHTQPSTMMASLVILHSGCGNHTDRSIAKHQEHIRQALARCHLLSLSNALAHGLGHLEREPSINAGVGGNLNIKGLPANDAGVMLSDYGYAAVADANATATPSAVALHLCEALATPKLLGRLRPKLLTGDGVADYCREHGLPVCDPEDLIADSSRSRYERARKMMADATSEQLDKGMPASKRAHYIAAGDSADDGPAIDDTIGCIAAHSQSIGAGASSGGILYKDLGRIGPSAIAGAGFWTCQRGDTQVAVCTSGTGELIMEHMLALRLADWALDEAELSQDKLEALLSRLGVKIAEGQVFGAVLLRMTKGEAAQRYEMVTIAYGGSLVYGWQMHDGDVKVETASPGTVSAQLL
eukprot:TRINITY_DN11208_c0_g1_i5.p2 TRINITY_DN11208_c0_g1~~TRINITY_DN11208_c0_g1_i5.p2  ORF type:complete len:366 (+),score=43.82 TRINITY_DN11208_c0_g1_i5:2853-3950(+)